MRLHTHTHMFVCEMCCIGSIEVMNLVYTCCISVKNMWAVEQVCVVSDILCRFVDTAVEILWADFFLVQKYCF